MKKFAFSSMLLFLLLFPIASASAEAFSDLYVFGDSLSDSGQLPDIFAGHLHLRATNRVDPLDPSSETAKVWPQYLSQYLGVGDFYPSDALFGPRGTNYAVVGYTAHQILSSITDKFLVRQPVADPHSLYVVWGGGNDLLAIRDARAAGGPQSALTSDSETAADTIVSGVMALGHAGVKVILVPNLPDIGDVPESHLLGSGAITAGNDATRVFNDRLRSGLNRSGLNVIQADIGRLFREMTDHPVMFGFSDEDQRVVAFDGSAFTHRPAEEGRNGAGSDAPDPSAYIFFDGIHPTTYAADIIAQYYLSILEAPGRYAILAEVPLNLVRAHMDAIEAQLSYLQSGAPRTNTFHPFISGGYDYRKSDQIDTRAPGYEDRQYSVTAGFTYILPKNWIIGAALGRQTGKVELDDDAGGFDMDALLFSIMAGCRLQRLRLTAMGGLSELDYGDITRKIKLGPMRRTHKGETSGVDYAVKLSASLDLLRRNGFTLGPLASLDYQKVEVNGYRESDRLSTAMDFHDQSRRSLLLGIGLFARKETHTPFGPLQAYGDIRYEKECKGDQRVVRAGLVTLAPSTFELPVPYPETDLWRVHLGLGIGFAKNWEAKIIYHAVIGRDTTISQGGVISIQTSF